MKRFISNFVKGMAFIMLIAGTVFGCRTADPKMSAPINGGEKGVERKMMVSALADYEAVTDPAKLVTRNENAFKGTVTGISFDVMDRDYNSVPGKCDENQMLSGFYTVYAVRVDEVYKGTVEIGQTVSVIKRGGLEGTLVEEQTEYINGKMGTSYESCVIVSTESPAALDKDSEYLFLTNQAGKYELIEHQSVFSESISLDRWISYKSVLNALK